MKRALNILAGLIVGSVVGLFLGYMVSDLGVCPTMMVLSSTVLVTWALVRVIFWVDELVQ